MATSTYSKEVGYGFLDASEVSGVDRKTEGSRGSFCTASSPFVFAVDLPEGNYDVKVTFGDPAEAASTAIKAEARRLLLAETPTTAGQIESRTFTLNVRTPAIPGGGEAAIDAREKGTPDWDDKLTLEFNGKRPCIASVEISEAPSAVTLFIAGDSTVTDQPNEPWSGWGMMLPSFLQPGIAVSNQAHSGLALFSFESQKRLQKILATMKKGDYLFIQFGHNDQKDKRPGAGAATTYTADLKRYVEAVRAKEGLPVLVTSMERRLWKGDEFQPSLGAYADAVRQVGQEMNVPVIDLNAMSMVFYKALGPEPSKQAFVHYPANTFPGQDKPLADNTHHNAYGAYELARCIVEGIRAQVPALAPFLREGIGTFDPAKPDAPSSLGIPPSLSQSVEKPAGN
ncbi:rhamnogalacturonan acetylesterase [Verrucomicrobium sp. GAS474]|uniref:rhamnogalacturonan acetylesterase n=1 Tax=Verrucomicrobium sp. GAS474 TaxID=1882831 RepID=UPI0012FF7949|nr:rhamnogalacturonan acetylesterase [Verrucomicrobium sp. GAS474]